MDNIPNNTDTTAAMHMSIALWTHPRSMSTAVERYFLERGDFQVFHEEFAYVFMGSNGSDVLPHAALDPEHPYDYESIRDYMEDARKHRPVFHKDMCYHALSYLLKDDEYLKNQTHIFLIRDPAEAVLSHATVHPELSFNTLGFAEMPTLFERIRSLTGVTPLIITASELTDDAESVLRRMCEYIGVRFDPSALCWDASMPSTWKSWGAWHTEAAARNSIGAPKKNYSVAFETHPKLKVMAEYCSPFYQYLKSSRTILQQEKAS